MTDLRDLYQEVILDHNKSPHNFRAMPDADRIARRPQPALRRPADALREARRRRHRATSRFQGSGCAISKASASLMTDAVKGKTLAEAEALFGKFHDLLTGPPDVKADATRRPRQARRLLRRPRVPRPRQVRDARLAHAPRGPRREQRRLHGVTMAAASAAARPPTTGRPSSRRSSTRRSRSASTPRSRSTSGSWG